MSALILLLTLAAASVLLVRCICVSARLSLREWEGHPLKFFGLSISHALVCGGAVGTVMSWPPAPTLLLLGAAGWVVFDRRVVFRRDR